MKRDDFGMRIDEIRELATKYSKQDLSRMVRMGMLDPQRALMAGMMIDRITKSAMQPPQSTVAEDVLAPQMPTTAQGQLPPGIMAAPGAPPPSAGVAALPSGIKTMAGGGIVAFADGGETDDVPGFADGRLIDAEALMPSLIAAESRGNPNAISPRGARGLAQLMPGTARRPGYGIRPARDESQEENVRVGRDYLDAMLKKYGNVDYALAAYNWGPGNVDKWIARGAKQEELPAETREYIPRVKAGLASKDKLPAPKLVQDILNPLLNIIPAAEAREPRMVEDPSQARGEGGVRTIPPVIAGPKSANPPVSSEPPIKPAPAPEPAKPEFKVTEAPVAPGPAAAKEEPIVRPTAPTTELLDVPAEPKFADEYGKVQEAYRTAGLNVDLYKEMRDELKTKKASFGEKRDRALGMALMSFGLGLAGARQGQVAQTLSQQGIRALAGYADSMDKIADNEERLDALDRQIRLADNQFRMTGADSAMRRVENLQQQRTNIMAKNVEMANKAKEHQYTVGASLYQTDVQAKVQMEAAAARIAAILGQNRGGFTDPQLVKLRTDMELQYGPALREQYKDRGSKEQIEKIVAEKIDQKVIEEVNKARGIRAQGNIPVPSSGSGWSVSGGVD